MPQIACFCENK